MKLSVVRENVRGPLPFASQAVFTMLEEAELKSMLERVVEQHPEVEVGSYPKWFDPEYKTKVTFDGRESSKVDAAVTTFVRLLPENMLVRVE